MFVELFFYCNTCYKKNNKMKLGAGWNDKESRSNL
jgi:hypothetical protein